MSGEMKWAGSPVGNAVDGFVAEIKDLPYVIVFFSDLKDQEYNEAVLNQTGLGWAFLSLAAADKPDSPDNYLFAYFVKMKEDVYQAVFTPSFPIFFKADYFRVYYNAECIGAFTKTPPPDLPSGN